MGFFKLWVFALDALAGGNHTITLLPATSKQRLALLAQLAELASPL
jgi:hypothetical protein